MLNTAELKLGVIVVGAGAAGTTAAFMLAKEGQEVVLLEKEKTPGNCNRLGGRMNGCVPDDRTSRTWGETYSDRDASRKTITLLNGEKSASIDCQQIDRVTSPFHFTAESIHPEERRIILFGGTRRGVAVASRIASEIDAGLHQGCDLLPIPGKGKPFLLDQLLFGGTAVKRAIFTGPPSRGPRMRRTFQRIVAGGGGHSMGAGIIPWPGCVEDGERCRRVNAGLSLAEAGIETGGLGRIEEAAGSAWGTGLWSPPALGTGCRMRVILDPRTIPEEVRLNKAGMRLNPDLYIGVGASGRIQGMTGIRETTLGVPRNFGRAGRVPEPADYCVAGDLFTVIRILISELKKALRN